MKEIKGISASPGIAFGKAFLYIDENPPIPKYNIDPEGIEYELERFLTARRKASEEIEILKESSELGDDEQNFLDSHLLMLNDPEFTQTVEKSLRENNQNVEWILMQVINQLTQKLEKSKDSYLSERTSDIQDVARRVLGHLLYRDRISLSDISEEVVLVTHDLLPSDAIAMNKRMIKGIAMDAGGKTSHTAILARAFEIPAVLGLSSITKQVSSGEEIIIDGNTGHVVINPSEQESARYRDSLAEWHRREVQLMDLNDLPAETRDGKLIGLEANIEVPEEVESIFAHGADGIGLYRSEFLFLKPGHLPTEEEQYEAYSRVLRALGKKPVVIRTLDVGGDKVVPELAGLQEKNPILGWRAIRFCLSRLDLFKTQLRALLRSSVHGNLKINFPMISGIEELNRTLDLLGEVKDDLTREGIPFAEKIPIGIMVEVPSAALTSDILAKKVEFFSIGTNDLIQYTIAVDRGNENIAYLYEPFHPGVLRLIKTIIDNAHRQGIPVGMCGEMAGDPLASILLVGLGLDEFSMSAFSIPEVKRIIRSISMSEAEEILGNVMEMRSYQEIDAYVKKLMEERFEIVTY